MFVCDVSFLIVRCSCGPREIEACSAWPAVCVIFVCPSCQVLQSVYLISVYECVPTKRLYAMHHS